MPVESNAELLLTFRQFRDVLRDASSRLTYNRFREIAGLEDDDYAVQKYRDFGEISKVLGRFSPGFLEQLAVDELALRRLERDR